MIPILYVGAPGIGKTAKVKQQYDYCEILLLSSCTEEDIAGLPYRHDDKERRTLPRFVENINNISADKSVCLFLDEIDKARREVADTLLTLITNPSFFGIKRDIDIVAAANPPEWGGGDGISQAMQSRFSVIDANVDIREWSKWAKNKYTHESIHQFVDMVEDGKVPILEEVGEGYNFRLTCPRTIELSWIAMLNQRPELVDGLVTTNAATAIKSTFSKNTNLLQNKARFVAAEFKKERKVLVV